MKRIMVRVALVILVFVVSSLAWSQTPATADSEINARFSKSLGTDANRIFQHYYLVKAGGVIELTAKDPADKSSVAAVQKYLETQKDLFEKGKNEGDAEVHGKVADGVPVLKKLRNEITFFTVKSEEGAVLRMFSTNEQARQAIQDFIKFQINEHKTGDPLVVAEQ
jgi:hypothetical protein